MSKRNRWLGMLLTVAMLLTLIPMFALAGPENDGLIAFYEGGQMGMVTQEYEHCIYSSQLATDETWCEQHGISYDLESNTLSLNNVDLTSTDNNSLYIVNMGEDFKIKVSGNCKIKGTLFNLASYSNITIYSQNNGSLEFDAIQFDNTYQTDPAKIEIENNVTFTLNAGLAYPLKNREGDGYSQEELITYKGESSPALVFTDYGSGIMGSDHFYYFSGKIVFSPTAHIHTEKTVPAKDATCTEPGLTKGKVCEECGEVLEAQEEIPALGHNYKDGVCTRCGAQKPSPELISTNGNYLASKSYTGLELKNAPGDEYDYKFIVYNTTTKQWYKLQDFSDLTTYNWYTGPAGVKNLYVDIRNKSDHDDITRIALVNVNVTDTGLGVTNFTSSEGNEVAEKTYTTLAAEAIGGTSPYEYKFIVHNEDNGQWYKIQDFSSKNTCDWYTGPAANKTLYVDVRDADGTVVRKGLTVTVNE